MITFNPRDKKQVAYMRKIIKGIRKEELLSSLAPMPKHQPDPSKPKHFIAKGGIDLNTKASPNWYDWSVQHWGTKWEASDVSCDDEDIFRIEDDIERQKEESTLRLSFLSAWSPPTNALMKSKLTKLGIYYRLDYYEGGVGFFGSCENGEDISVSINFSSSVDFKNEQSIYQDLVRMAEEQGLDSSVVDNLGMEISFVRD
jgi:hypothetical protein